MKTSASHSTDNRYYLYNQQRHKSQVLFVVYVNTSSLKRAGARSIAISSILIDYTYSYDIKRWSLKCPS